jgi:hypothetical protein
VPIEQFTDVRSSPKDQIAHAAEVVGGPGHRRDVFVAIYKGKKRVKTVSEVVQLSGVRRIRVLQEAGVLADNKIVHRTKVGKELAYEKDSFYSQNKERILKLAGNKAALRRFPTKTNPKSEISVRLSIPAKMVKVKQVTVDDIDSFDQVHHVRPSSAQTPIDEKQFKDGLQRIIGEKGTFQDWGGEPDDLYSTRVILNGKRISTAFGLKGKGTSGPLVPKKMGKRGDQLQRLFAAPADLFLVQYWCQIDESIVSQMKSLAIAKSWSDSKIIYYGTIDGQDSQRLIAAYPSAFEKLSDRKSNHKS